MEITRSSSLATSLEVQNHRLSNIPSDAFDVSSLLIEIQFSTSTKRENQVIDSLLSKSWDMDVKWAE